MQRVSYRSSATWIIAVAWLAAVPALAAEPADGDAVLAEYFRGQTAAVGDACLAGVDTLQAWQARRGPARLELLDMLGLDPLPEKTPLAAIAPGPHEDGQELQLAALRWFDKHLRKEVRPIESSAQATLPREKLRVFKGLPADEVNTRIDETWFFWTFSGTVAAA
jgi:hypothetical protein